MGLTLNYQIDPKKMYLFRNLVAENFVNCIYVFSLLLTFYQSMIFPCVYVIIGISIKDFVDIRIVYQNLVLLSRKTLTSI